MPCRYAQSYLGTLIKTSVNKPCRKWTCLYLSPTPVSQYIHENTLKSEILLIPGISSEGIQPLEVTDHSKDTHSKVFKHLKECFPSWTLSLSSLQNQMILLTQYHLSSSSPLNLVQIFVIKQDQGSTQLSLCKEVRRHHPPPLPLVATSPKNTLWPCGDHTQWVLWTNLLLGGLLSRCWDFS